MWCSRDLEEFFQVFSSLFRIIFRGIIKTIRCKLSVLIFFSVVVYLSNLCKKEYFCLLFNGFAINVFAGKKLIK